MAEQFVGEMIGELLTTAVKLGYKWWKSKKGEVFEVIVKEQKRLIKVKEVPKAFNSHVILAEDILSGEDIFLMINETTPIKKLTQEEAEKMTLKRINIYRAINLIKDLTEEDGGVLSHQGSGPLPGPSAQCLLALYELDRFFPQENILPKDELEKRVQWLVDINIMKDWEGHQFNCFVVSMALWAITTVYNSISSEILKKKAILKIGELSLEVINNFDEKEKGWSWTREVRPTYPFYTFFALKALKQAEPFYSPSLLRNIRKISHEVYKGLVDYLKDERDYANTAMALWALQEILNKKIKHQQYLPKIVASIEKMESIPLHTNPIEYHLQIMPSTVFVALATIAPDNNQTAKAAKILLQWMRETQNEGWRWVHVGSDSSWATAWVLLAFLKISQTLPLVQQIL